MQHLWATMNIDPQNNKSDHIFSHNCLVRPHQKDSAVSPPEQLDLREVLIIWFHTYLSFRASLLFYLTISKMFNLTKCDLSRGQTQYKELLYRFEVTHLAHFQKLQRGQYHE